MVNKEGYKKIAVLWKKQTKDGQIFFSGKLDDHTQLYIMPNKFKKTPNAPDYHAFTMDTFPKAKNDPVVIPQATVDDL